MPNKTLYNFWGKQICRKKFYFPCLLVLLPEWTNGDITGKKGPQLTTMDEKGESSSHHGHKFMGFCHKLGGVGLDGWGGVGNLLAPKELYTWYCPMTIQQRSGHFLNTHRSLITTLSINAMMTLVTVITMMTKTTKMTISDDNLRWQFLMKISASFWCKQFRVRRLQSIFHEGRKWNKSKST